ncbi:unnamed protein product [Linum trigynum]|uniref:Uncharacterized protein n=1 Tax=Linum trigynum TaxID=586398 RepID=A0AAV2G6V7_9ROSI
MGKCPVCRKIFHAEDLEHVLNLVGPHSSQLSPTSNEHKDNENGREVLDSQPEQTRREKFESILKLQEESNGLIEPKKSIVVLPGMFLHQPVAASTPTSNEETVEQKPREAPPISGNSAGYTSDHANSFAKRQNLNRRNPNQLKNSQTQTRHWERKENGTSS